MTNEEFLLKLRQLCFEYDKSWGRWPESSYEGHSILEFCCDKLNGDKDKVLYSREDLETH